MKTTFIVNTTWLIEGFKYEVKIREYMHTIYATD